jgi:hypothetical protein
MEQRAFLPEQGEAGEGRSRAEVRATTGLRLVMAG